VAKNGFEGVISKTHGSDRRLDERSKRYSSKRKIEKSDTRDRYSRRTRGVVEERAPRGAM
tara:strand:+ start:1802 stop:1981 length:180 start_codon:yes stop_codon:yes gene_type:complete